MKIRIEIRPGEGGDDAKALVRLQADLYQNFAVRQNIHSKMTVATG